MDFMIRSAIIYTLGIGSCIDSVIQRIYLSFSNQSLIKKDFWFFVIIL